MVYFSSVKISIGDFSLVISNRADVESYDDRQGEERQKNSQRVYYLVPRERMKRSLEFFRVTQLAEGDEF